MIWSASIGGRWPVPRIVPNERPEGDAVEHDGRCHDPQRDAHEHSGLGLRDSPGDGEGQVIDGAYAADAEPRDHAPLQLREVAHENHRRHRHRADEQEEDGREP
jgi:hypothetical protein